MVLRRDGLKRHDELLDAALRSFAKHGLMKTGIEHVRREAGASPSSVYHHFAGLPGLTEALLTRTFERLFTELAAKVVRASSAERAVRALVQAHVSWVLAHPDEARFMYQATALELDPAAGDVFQARKAELLAPIVAHLRPFMAARELPRWSPLVFDLIVLGPTHEACRRYLAGAELDPKWMRVALPRLAWRSLGTASRAARRQA